MNRSTILAFVAGALIATGVVNAQTVSPSEGAPVDDKANREKQPHMRAALASLRAAKDDLQKASADKGGFRQKAIDLVNQAIDATQAGIDADNANGKDK